MLSSQQSLPPLRPTPSFLQDIPSPMSADMHPVLHTGRTAVITGAASGIGRAAAKELAEAGLKIALADTNEKGLKVVGDEIKAIVGAENVLIIKTDVSKLDEVERLRDTVLNAWGEVAVLLNNAAVGVTGQSWGAIDAWKKILDVNLWGVVNVQQIFIPHMLHQENPSMIINTGSKQGITNPPGNAAYNASKAAVKSLTESLAYELRSKDSKVTAHLFVPGWTHTGMTSDLGPGSAKPKGAWSAEETVKYMFHKVRAGHFYIICPDNETSSELDALRILWGAADVAEGRPALSRWHPEYKPHFDEYIHNGLSSIQNGNGH